eukprot:EG_transcript_30783
MDFKKGFKIALSMHPGAKVPKIELLCFAVSPNKNPAGLLTAGDMYFRFWGFDANAFVAVSSGPGTPGYSSTWIPRCPSGVSLGPTTQCFYLLKSNCPPSAPNLGNVCSSTGPAKGQ